MDLLSFLIIVSFGLFLFSFIFIMLDILKTKKKAEKGTYKKEGLSKLSGYSYGFGILAMLMLMFIGALLGL